MSEGSLVSRFFGAIWRGFEFLKKLIQILFVIIFISVLATAFSARDVRVPESGALLLAPAGMLVEELSGDAVERAFAEARGGGVDETLLRDVTESLEAAADDDRITAVVMQLDEFEGGGLSKLQAVGRSLEKVREAGKPIIVFGDSFTQNQYYLAAYADEIYLHSLGTVYIDGYAYFRAFFKSALEKLSVDLNVFRVGEFKSFVEPFVRNDMSKEDKLASQRWLNALWSDYQRDVVAARELSPGALDDYAADFAGSLEAANGNTAELALQAGLIDELLSREAAHRKVLERVGASEDDEDEYDSIHFSSYAASMRKSGGLKVNQDSIAVVVASGEIIDGEASAGTIGGDSLSALIADAAKDDNVKAMVLRIDSPGGSMFASEVVFEQLQEFKATGKPLVASMSSVAASGGYYIAMLGDEIWANESTITGSIGIGAIVPTVQRSLDQLGVHIDGIGTTPLSGEMRPDRELSADARRIIQATIEEGYRIFVGKVAESRELSGERADEVARGRVWIGSDAYERGLIDQFGDLPQAIEAAAGMAGLDADTYAVDYISKELTLRERLVMELAIFAGPITRVIAPDEWFISNSLLQRVVDGIERELQWVASLNDPRGLYYHCFCRVP